MSDIIYKTKISKYGLAFTLYLMKNIGCLPPYTILKYNKLYMLVSINKDLINGYVAKIENVFVPEDNTEFVTDNNSKLGTIMLPDPILLTTDELEEIYRVRYKVSTNCLNLDQNLDPNLDANNYSFSKKMFHKDKECGYRFYTMSNNQALIQVINALSDYDCPQFYASTIDIFENVFVYLMIDEKLFEQLPNVFTIDDILSPIRNDLERYAYNGELLWREIVNRHTKKQPVVIPVSKSLIFYTGKVYKYYIEEPNQYGVYQGRYVEPTYSYEKIRRIIISEESYHEL